MSGPNDLFVKCLTFSNDKHLFIFPHAGATPASYIGTIKRMNIECNVYVLSLPGRLFQDKAKAFVDFHQTLAAIKVSIESHINGVAAPEIYFFGHSMGSLFSYELAKYFSLHKAQSLKTFAISSLRLPDHRFRAKKISLLDDKEFINYIETFHFIPDEIKNQPSFYADVIKTLKNDFKIIDSYKEPLRFFNSKSKAFIFGFDQDSIAPAENLIRWSEYFSESQGPILFSGGHFDILKYLDVMLKKIVEK